MLPDALAGLDVLATSPTGSGKTLAFAVADRGADVARTPAARRRSSSYPTRELAAQVTAEIAPPGQGQGPDGGRRRTGACRSHAQAKRREARPRARRDAGPSRGSRSSAGSSTSAESASSSSTRPTGCSTWASSRRSTGSCARLPRNRQTMFFSATLDGEVGELAREYTNSSVPLRSRPRERSRTARSTHHFVAVTHDTKVETLVEHLRAADVLDPRLRPDEARRRPARHASSARHDVTAVAMHGDLSQTQRQRALARVREREGRSARRNRRRRARPRHRRHRARRQLRPADRATRSYVHRTGRTGRAGRERNGDHPRAPRPAGRHEPRRDGVSATASSSSRRRARVRAREGRLHEPQGPPLQVVTGGYRRPTSSGSTTNRN